MKEEFDSSYFRNECFDFTETWEEMIKIKLSKILAVSTSPDVQLSDAIFFNWYVWNLFFN